MSKEKRYYWLKLQDGFFNSKRIKKLRRFERGDTYTLIYLEMQLEAMKHDGVLTWTGLEEDFASEIALDLNEDIEDVKQTLNYLISRELVITSDNVSFFFPYAVENTGSEGASAQRWRDWKERQSLVANAQPLETNATLTDSKQNANGEIDKDIEIELEQDKEKENPICFFSKSEKDFQQPADRIERIDHFIELLLFAERYGYDKTGTYRLAENEGITREEIDERRRTTK